MSRHMVYGYVNDQPLTIPNEKHTLIMASTRSGKGTTLIIPHLLRYSGSAFVLDPKGENAYATGRRREALNEKVHYLDPFDICGRPGPKARFNPLSRFTPATVDSDSKTLAAALVLAKDREDHWTQSAQQLIALLISDVYLSPTLPAEGKDLNTVRRHILDAPRQLKVISEQKGPAFERLRDLALSFLETPEKERGSIFSTAQRQTDVLDNPNIAACLAASGPGPEVNFADWHDHTMTVYLCLAAPKFPVFNRWLRLVLVAALDEMTTTLNPPKLPICFMLDELATLGHVEAIENAIGLAAGYGIQLYTVFQDIGQMKDLYEGRWSSFIGNAGVRALFSLEDIDTAEYWSRFLGERLVETHSRTMDNAGLSPGMTVSERMHSLLTPDELMINYASDSVLLMVQGMRPIPAQRIPYWDKRTGLDGLWDDPRKREMKS